MQHYHADWLRKGPFIATQLNSIRRRVELRRRSVYSNADATQLNSTSSCRHIYSVNNCHRSVLNVATQFVGHDVIYDVFWRVCREMEFWSEEFEEKLTELWKKACLFIWNDWPASRWLAVRCSTGSDALPIVGDSWVASVRVSIAMQLNSTRRRVELRRYKRALRHRNEASLLHAFVWLNSNDFCTA